MATDLVDDRVDGSIEIFFFDRSDPNEVSFGDAFVDEIDLDAEFASPFIFNNVLS